MTQEILNYLQNYFVAFLFLLERFTLLFFIFPLFTTAYLPARVKVALSLVLSLALAPVIKLNIPFPDSPLALFFLLLFDFLIFFLLSIFFKVYPCWNTGRGRDGWFADGVWYLPDH
jgi:flagellar biosynthetic protein FliR